MILSGNRKWSSPVFLLIVSLVPLVTSGKTGKEDFTMKITTTLNKQNMIVDTVDEVPVIPLGFDITFNGIFENAGKDEITIEDPDASQKIIVQCKADGKNETSFLLHPSKVDATGEVTCIPVELVKLKTNESKAVKFSLYPTVMDKCFSPGIYQIVIFYNSLKSEPCPFAISFKKESVSQLLIIIEDKSKDRWIRNTAYKWLKKLKPDFDYNFNENNNRESIEKFKSWWEENKNTEQIKSKFYRLKW